MSQGRRSRVLEFRSTERVAADPELAAAVVRDVVRAAGAQRLLVRSLTLRLRSIEVEVDVPEEVATPAAERQYLYDVGCRIVDVVQAAMRRASSG